MLEGRLDNKVLTAKKTVTKYEKRNHKNVQFNSIIALVRDHTKLSSV